MTRLIKRNLKIFEELLISKDNEVCLPKTNIKACGATESKIYKKLIRENALLKAFYEDCQLVFSLSVYLLCHFVQQSLLSLSDLLSSLF